MDSNVYSDRSIAYQRKKELDLAMADLTKAIELEPGSAAAYYSRGLIYKDMKKYDLAVTDFRKVADLAKDPRIVKAVMEEIQRFSG